MEAKLIIFINVLVTFVLLELAVILILVLMYCLSKEGSKLEDATYELLGGFFTSLLITATLAGVFEFIKLIFNIWK